MGFPNKNAIQRVEKGFFLLVSATRQVSGVALGALLRAYSGPHGLGCLSDRI